MISEILLEQKFQETNIYEMCRVLRLFRVLHKGQRKRFYDLIKRDSHNKISNLFETILGQHYYNREVYCRSIF